MEISEGKTYITSEWEKVDEDDFIEEPEEKYFKWIFDKKEM